MLLLCLLVSNAGAAPVEFTYELVIRSNTGQVKGWKLERGSKGYSLNGLRLKPELIVSKAAALQALTLVRPSLDTTSCRAGGYVFRATQSQKPRIEKGCMEGQRFSELKAAYAALGAL